MWGLAVGLSAVRNTSKNSKKVKTMLHVVYASAEMYN